MFVVSSVVPKKNRVVKRAAGKTKVLWLNPRLNLGVGIDYPAPKTIGADRLANAAAVAALYGCPAIVVDFGTAVTFDIVSKRGNYIGGVIAPGLEAMTNFLYQRTALLPKLSLQRTAPRDRKIDNRRDDVGRGFWLSRFGARDHRADQGRAISARRGFTSWPLAVTRI